MWGHSVTEQSQPPATLASIPYLGPAGLPWVDKPNFSGSSSMQHPKLSYCSPEHGIAGSVKLQYHIYDHAEQRKSSSIEEGFQRNDWLVEQVPFINYSRMKGTSSTPFFFSFLPPLRLTDLRCSARSVTSTLSTLSILSILSFRLRKSLSTNLCHFALFWIAEII
jgi:hypothetical protein